MRAAHSNTTRTAPSAAELRWRRAAREVERALRAWTEAERDARAGAYTAYVAALDREELAAQRLERVARRARA